MMHMHTAHLKTPLSHHCSSILVNSSETENNGISIPPGWCDESRNAGGCICDHGIDVINFLNDR